VLDHVFLDTVGAMRQALDDALLERHPREDRLAMDILLGDLVWETSCSLPGDGIPPRVRADLTIDWPTWSQAAWRSLVMGEPADDPPEIGIEIVLRVQRLSERPDVDKIMTVLPSEGPELGSERLERSGPVVEESYQTSAPTVAIEVGYEGTYRLPEDGRSVTKQLTEDLAILGGWIASALVRLGDLRFDYLPPDPDED
jgi:hypothetical protein